MAKTVLLIDDSELILDLAGDELEDAGYDVVRVQDWKELNNLLKNVQPDLVLMDVRMPQVHDDLVQKLKTRSDQKTTVPILLYSDLKIDRLEKRTIESQADGYVSKSWGFDRMVEVVTQHLEKGPRS